VPKLTRDQRREAIVQPVAGRIESMLVQELLNATDEETEDLPVMQHALMRCWHQATTGATSDPKIELTLSHYNRIGGIEKALSNHADEIYHELLESAGKNRDDVATATEYLFRALTAIDFCATRPASPGILPAPLPPPCEHWPAFEPRPQHTVRS
jgi:hypothetical protein